MRLIPYRSDLDIRNLDQLPKGPGCRYLRCIIGQDGALVAAGWHRKEKAALALPGTIVDMIPEPPVQTLPENVTQDDVADAISPPPAAECLDLFGADIEAAASRTATEGKSSPFASATPPRSSPDAVAAPAAEHTADGNGAKPTGLAARLAERAERAAPAPTLGRVGGQKVAGYTPTDEQATVLATSVAAQTGRAEAVVIAAGAGAGKTSTLKMLEQVLKGKGQYTAFNSSLVAESRTKFVRAGCNTTHSLAFKEVGRRYAHRLNGPRVRSETIAYKLGIQAMTVDTGEVKEDGTSKLKVLQPGFLAGQVLGAIRRFCQSADRAITAGHFPYIDGIDASEGGRRRYANNDAVKEYLVPFAERAWADLSSPEGTLPCSSLMHDTYVKVWQLGTDENRPFIAADYILLDEAQDTAPVFLDILRQQSHAMLVMVGDSNQAIYEWRGAVDAMKAFAGAPRSLLSQSFRFGQTIADLANSILAELDEPTDLVMRGLPGLPSRVDVLADPKCVLCRTNAMAVGTLLQGYKDGKKVHLIGGGAETVKFVKAAKDLQEGRATSHPELGCFDTWAEVEAYVATDEGGDLKLMVKIIKAFGCDAIIEALENMPEEKDADLVCSTAHKSKGREWDTVKLAGDFPTRNKMGDSDRRLLYVAATRAKYVLDVSECPPFCGGRDEQTGKPIMGIKVDYTVPMPSAEELDAYLAAKGTEVQKSVAVAEPAPSSAVRMPEAPLDQEFTWSNYNGDWVVRGPKGHAGKVAKVTRKNGTSSYELLKAVVKEWPDKCLYRVK